MKFGELLVKEQLQLFARDQHIPWFLHHRGLLAMYRDHRSSSHGSHPSIAKAQKSYTGANMLPWNNNNNCVLAQNYIGKNKFLWNRRASEKMCHSLLACQPLKWLSYTNLLCSTLPENFSLPWNQSKDIKTKGKMILFVLKRQSDVLRELWISLWTIIMFVSAETSEGIEHTGERKAGQTYVFWQTDSWLIKWKTQRHE